jgi:hypothetical protein
MWGFFTFMWPRIVTNFFLIKVTDALNSPKFIFVKKIYLIRAVPLPIIRSSPLYIRHWYTSCNFDESFQARPGCSRNSTCFGHFLCPSSGVLHCTFGTGIHHASLMRVFKHVQDAQETLHVSGSSSAHLQGFSTVHSALVYVIRTAWHIPVPNIQWRTPDDGQRNCVKHVEFLDKNKFGKI